MLSRSRAPVESMTRGSSCGMNGSSTGSEPAAMIAESNDTVLVDPSGVATDSMLGEVKVPVPTQGLDFALFGEAGQAAGQPLHHAVFPAAQRVEVDGGGGEGEPGVAHLLGFGDDFGGVEQGFGGDAADVEADPAQGAAGVDHDDLAAQVGGPERGGVAARAGPRHQHLGMHITLLPGEGAGAPTAVAAARCSVGGAADDPYPAGAVSFSSSTGCGSRVAPAPAPAWKTRPRRAGEPEAVGDVSVIGGSLAGFEGAVVDAATFTVPPVARRAGPAFTPPRCRAGPPGSAPPWSSARWRPPAGRCGCCRWSWNTRANSSAHHAGEHAEHRADEHGDLRCRRRSAGK